jgi:hypothetical protein
VADTEVGEAARIVCPNRNVTGQEGHPVVDAAVPAQRSERIKIADAVAGIADAALPGHHVRTRGRGQHAVDVGVETAAGRRHADCKLAAEDWGGEDISRTYEAKIGARAKICIEIDGDILRKLADCDLTRRGDIAAPGDRSIIIDDPDIPAWCLRDCGKTAELARKPKTHAAFVSQRAIYSRSGEYDRDERDPGDQTACAAVS